MNLLPLQGGFNGIGIAAKVARYYNLANVQILNAKKDNPYDGKLPTPNVKDAPLRTSVLGTPIYTDLTLKALQPYTDFTGKTVIPNTDDIQIDTVIITVDQPIRIVKTEIQGRDGTVKEYIGKDDAKITVNGVICGTNGSYPTLEVINLKRWLDAPLSKEITAWWLDQLGISQIVVESYSIPQVEGGYSYQMFSFQAISDNPVELKITQPNV